jgi:hypothetical protein
MGTTVFGVRVAAAVVLLGASVGMVVLPGADAEATCVRTVDIGDAVHPEGSPGAASPPQIFTFAVTSTGCAAGGTIGYATADGGATAGSDYTATSGFLTFATGDMSDQQITVSVTPDFSIETDEEFRVYTCAGTDLVTPGTPGRGLIRNDDFATFQPADPPVVVRPHPSLHPLGYGCGR